MAYTARRFWRDVRFIVGCQLVIWGLSALPQDHEDTQALLDLLVGGRRA